MPPNRPKKPTDTRAVVDSVAPILRQAHPLPDRPFSEDVVHEAMRSHTEGPCELGEYRPEDDQSLQHAGRLGGTPQTIAFDRGWWAWFTKLTPELRAALHWVADAFRDPKRQAALLEIVDERIERRVLRNFFRRLKHAAVATVIATALVAHWFSDQIAWIVEKIPVLKAFWNLITGAR